MPLIQGVDSRGRPVYSNPVGDAVPNNPGGRVTPDKLQQAVDQVDPQEQPQKYNSQIDYSFLNNRNSTIKQQGSAATERAKIAAQQALQERLARVQAASDASARGSAQNWDPSKFVGAGTGTNLRQRIIARVASQKGVDYKWGAESPGEGFDCSGLVQWAYGKLGIKMPRVSGQQAKVGVKWPVNKLQPGDLVAHPGHIAVYAGNGMMWEAPHTGAQVRLVPVRSNMYGVHLTLPGD